MATFILRRSVYSLLLLLVASVVLFYGLRATPGPGSGFPAEYVLFMKGLLSGDPGISLVSGAAITKIIGDSGANTLKLAGAAAILIYALAIPLGVLAASRPNSLRDRSIRTGVVLGMGIPNLFLAILLIQLFAVKLRWLPVAGPGGLRHVALPAIVLAMEALAINVRLIRSSLLDELSTDYVRALRAKGLSGARVLWIHALRNAAPPVLALAGITLPLLVGYTMIVEVIFRFEGLGFQLVNAVLKRDFPLAQTLAILFTAFVVLCNFLADVGHQIIDPRVRERARIGGL